MMLGSKNPMYCQYGFNNLVIAMAVTVLSVSYYIVYCYELNIPQWDDFSLSLILLWLKGNADGLLAALSILFSQFFEHKLVVYRLLAYSDYYLFGQLDFKHLAYIGNSVNVILMILLCKIIKNDDRRSLVAVPVILMFLVSFQWVGQAWRSGAGGTYALAFAGLAFYFVAHETNQGSQRSFLAIVFSTLAMFTTSNGLLVSPVIIAYFLCLQKRFNIILWGMVALAQWSLFFLYDYEKVHYMISPSDLFEKVSFFIVLSGSALSFGNPTVAWVFGLILIVSILFLTIKRYVIINPPVYLFLLFNVLTVAAISWGRSKYGLETAISERYLYISLITCMLVYIGMQEILYKKSVKIWAFFVCTMSALFLSFGLYSCYSGISALEMEKSTRIQTLTRWLIADDGLRFTATLESDFVLSTMLKSGFYSIPSAVTKTIQYSQEVSPESLCGIENDGKFQVVYDVIRISSEGSRSHLIRVEGIIAEETDPSKPLYIVFNSGFWESHYYPARIVNLQNLELSGLWENASRRRFVALIPASNLKKGRYRVGICDGERLVFNESRTLVTEGIAAGLWRIHWIKRLIIEERHSLIGYAQSVSSLIFDN